MPAVQIMTMIGERVGNYRIVEPLGEGGMGVVFLAEHEALGKRAAVKLLLPRFSHDEEILARFFNEARATTQIGHPGLVDIYDFGHHAGSGSAFIIIELLDGETLGARLRRDGRLHEPLLIELTQQIGAALGAAHARGIVHRDLKPDNVFLLPDRTSVCGLRTKVLDFGVAKLLTGDSASKTRTGAILGTPMYMSPEQCRGLSKIDARADVYSLGCMMYVMAAGQAPFSGEGVGDVLAAHIYQPAPSLAEHAPHVSAALCQVVARAMAKRPEDRYPSMDALTAELVGIGMERRALGVTLVGNTLPSAAPLFTTTLGNAAAAVESRAVPERRRRRAWLLGASAFVLLSAAGFAVLRNREEALPPAREPPPTAAAAVRDRDPAPPLGGVGGGPPEGIGSPPSSPRKIKLTLESLPAGAAVFRVSDGVRLGRTPYEEEREAGAGEAVYLLRLSGYVDREVALALADDGHATLTLEHSAAHKPHAPKLPAQILAAPATAPPPVSPPPRRPNIQDLKNPFPE